MANSRQQEQEVDTGRTSEQRRAQSREQGRDQGLDQAADQARDQSGTQGGEQRRKHDQAPAVDGGSGQPTGDRSQGRQQLVDALNEDLAREYQAIIAYVIYSQVLRGAEYMSIAGELEVHAAEELKHAIAIAKQIDYLGGTPTATPLPVRVLEDPRAMLRADLDNEVATIRAYRQRVRECDALEEYAMAEEIREILRQEQEHAIDLATALGEDVPAI